MGRVVSAARAEFQNGFYRRGAGLDQRVPRELRLFGVVLRCGQQVKPGGEFGVEFGHVSVMGKT